MEWRLRWTIMLDSEDQHLAGRARGQARDDEFAFELRAGFHLRPGVTAPGHSC
jgi:hypothetical protein